MDAPPLFTVQVKDLEYGDQELDEDIPVSWLETALRGTEARAAGQPGHVEVTLTKTGREIVVRGRVRAKVVMPCARTLDPVDIPLDAEVFVMLEPAAAAASAHAGRAKRSTRQRREPEKKPEKHGAEGAASRGARRETKGAGRTRHAEEPELGDEEAAADTYDGEKVVLDGFLREFLLLELPLFPLREDLRSEATPAIDVPPAPAHEGRPTGQAVDPRLAPLAAIASRLREKKE